MNTVVEREQFRRPCPTPTELCNKAYPDLRKAACHEANSGRQGRSDEEVRTQGINRVHASKSLRHGEKRILRIPSYPIMGNNTVEAVRYTEPRQSVDEGLVWINKTQYFKGIPLEVWNFALGGCEICQKWLKDREGRCLSSTDIRQYQRIVIALKEMIELMAGIDAVLQHGQFNEEKLSVAAHH